MKILNFHIDPMGQVYLLGDDGIIRSAEIHHGEDGQEFHITQDISVVWPKQENKL